MSVIVVGPTCRSAAIWQAGLLALPVFGAGCIAYASNAGQACGMVNNGVTPVARQYIRKKPAHIDMRVEPEIIAEIDAWRARQQAYVSRTAAILYMVRQFLDHDVTGNWPTQMQG